MLYIYIYAHTCVYMHIYIYVYIRMYVYLSLSIYIYIHTYTYIHTLKDAPGPAPPERCLAVEGVRQGTNGIEYFYILFYNILYYDTV